MGNTITLGVTPGEPAGIGPDLLLKLVQAPQLCELVAYADPDLLLERAAALGLPLCLRPPNGQPLEGGELAIRPVLLAQPVVPGNLDVRNAHYVLATLQMAVEHCQSGLIAGMVTGPVNKAIINEAGVPFSGHTEFLAEQTDTDQVVMMLATDGMKVALVTTHLPLHGVPAAITGDLVASVIRILHRDLKTRFGLAAPRILVCGLNPHAGENGHLGHEEIDIIIPALETVRSEGIQALGPFPADTVFTPKVLAGGDVVLTMYHDQGLPVLKYQGFGRAVNVTLGLPIIRTSVDHGTALDLAATGKGDIGSLEYAIHTALTMAEPGKTHE
jgi:4-hydroxythreonine-4-phosphate dehydrogenase